MKNVTCSRGRTKNCARTENIYARSYKNRINGLLGHLLLNGSIFNIISNYISDYSFGWTLDVPLLIPAGKKYIKVSTF